MLPHSNHMQIRAATTNDAAQILEIYAPNITELPISFEEQVPTLSEMKERIEKVTKKFPWLVAVNAQAKLLGYAYACAHRDRAAYRWSADVSAYVHSDFRGQGIAKLLYAQVLTQLRAKNYYRAFAGIVIPNPASIALHESLGFRPLGIYKNVGFKLGAWRDVGWWELQLQPLACPPQEPISNS